MNQGHLEFCASPQWRQMVETTILPEALRGLDLGDDVLEVGPGARFDHRRPAHPKRRD